jgi:hypothetical protein
MPTHTYHIIIKVVHRLYEKIIFDIWFLQV